MYSYVTIIIKKIRDNDLKGSRGLWEGGRGECATIFLFKIYLKKRKEKKSDFPPPQQLSTVPQLEMGPREHLPESISDL